MKKGAEPVTDGDLPEREAPTEEEAPIVTENTEKEETTV